jgi:hypothetical protein
MKISCDPKSWGPHAWNFLYSIAKCYPENPTHDDIKHFKLFFLSLPYVLPCLTCQEHLLDFMSKKSSHFDEAFRNNQTLFRYIIDMNNHVNKILKKPLLSYP